MPTRAAPACTRAAPRRAPARHALAGIALSLAGAFLAAPAAPPAPAAGAAASVDPHLGVWTTAWAEYGDVKYPDGFAHYDFVNPDAPKGGTIRLSNPDRRTSYDKYNPYTLPDSAPAGLDLFMFERLAEASPDELATMYGLVASEFLVAPDYASVSFRIDPRARFNNGDPVTAADVKYSFEMLSGEKASPTYSQYFDGVAGATVVDPRTVRFDLKVPSRDQIFELATQLRVFSTKWGLGPDGKPRPFDRIVHEEPITTGPYRIFKATARTLDLERDPHYWARDIGVRRGFYNFDHVVYHYFIDNAARFEAFKSGDFDLLRELRPARWVRQYVGPKFADGRIVKQRLRDGMGFFYEGYLFNTRRPQLQDRRVREALADAFDWTWSSRQAFDMDARYGGLFENSIFAASGAPGPGELALLEPYRSELPAEIFGPLPRNPPTDTPQALRANLLHARALLAAAGWQLAADGRLRNARGEPFEIEVLDSDLEFANIVGHWARQLEKLGIAVRERLVDYAVYEKRMDASDYDVTLINYGNVKLPSAGTLDGYFGSAAARTPGSNNWIGMAEPAADHALAAMAKAETLQGVVDAARVLDRIFVAGHYAVPYIYRPFNNVAYWNRFGIPATLPKYYSVEDGLDAMAWPISTWWSAPPAPGAARGSKE